MMESTAKGSRVTRDLQVIGLTLLGFLVLGVDVLATCTWIAPVGDDA